MKTIEHSLSDGAMLTAYIHEDIYPEGSSYSERPGILVFPGGGYQWLSKRENEPVVLEFLSRGYQLFVLEYAVGRKEIEKREPEAEAAEAVSWIRQNRALLKTTHVVLMGFSAGGHLALSLMCHWKDYGILSRPDAGILSYPVVTMQEEYTHMGSRNNITGGDEERVRRFSLESQVDSSLPPVFVWHTREDQSVPPMNTILLLEALEKNGVEYEYHIYSKGQHGLSVCRRETKSEEKRAAGWMDEADSWLKDLLSFQQ